MQATISVMLQRTSSRRNVMYTERQEIWGYYHYFIEIKSGREKKGENEQGSMRVNLITKTPTRTTNGHEHTMLCGSFCSVRTLKWVGTLLTRHVRSTRLASQSALMLTLFGSLLCLYERHDRFSLMTHSLSPLSIRSQNLLWLVPENPERVVTWECLPAVQSEDQTDGWTDSTVEKTEGGKDRRKPRESAT